MTYAYAPGVIKDPLTWVLCHHNERAMGSADELNQFLANVEKRAYSMALVAVKNQEDALDIVQDVMLTLVRKYSNKPADEWRPLFYRILRNRITDFYRSTGVRNRVFKWFNRTDEGEEAASPIEQFAAPAIDQPEHQHLMDGVRVKLQDAVGALPKRQQQAFMLRAWDGMDVKSTALAMGCSQGSVKTHFSRAVHALRLRLEEYKSE